MAALPESGSIFSHMKCLIHTMVYFSIGKVLLILFLLGLHRMILIWPDIRPPEIWYPAGCPAK